MEIKGIWAKSEKTQPSLEFCRSSNFKVYSLFLSGLHGADVYRQQSLCKTWGTPWTSHKSITGTQRETNKAFTRSLTYRYNLELPINLTCMFWVCERKPRACRRHTHAREEHVNSPQKDPRLKVIQQQSH